jgi:hydrogenase expression/formation protein HypC
MCLAVPARVVALLEGEMATVELGGLRLPVSLELVEDVQLGDYVIVHTGYAIGRMDAVEAERTLAALAALPEVQAA